MPPAYSVYVVGGAGGELAVGAVVAAGDVVGSSPLAAELEDEPCPETLTVPPTWVCVVPATDPVPLTTPVPVGLTGDPVTTGADWTCGGAEGGEAVAVAGGFGAGSAGAAGAGEEVVTAPGIIHPR
jgi:hypothetical protein